MLSERWSSLAEFVELFYERPLEEPESGPPEINGPGPPALAEWEWLTGGRYRSTEGFLFVCIELIDPSERMNPPERDSSSPREWLGVVTDASGHAVWFVDPKDPSDDPPVFHWDDESDESGPVAAHERLSDLLTWMVIRETLELTPQDGGQGPLGSLQSGIRFTVEGTDALSSDPRSLNRHGGWPEHGPQVREHVDGLELTRLPIHDLEAYRSGDGSVFRYGNLVVTRTPEAWEPIERLLAAEAAALEERRKAEQDRRARETTRRLEAVGVVASPDALLGALEAIEAKLSRLEKAFLQDFRARVRARGVLDSQLVRAARIAKRHASG